ncbi:hypothetical protein [Methylobacterium oryzisoli]|uniref:hypothetical protein n=1 Tax=Methylobacterium oryzisoli TaxID=3385502 RepID=UPI003892A933
MEADVVVAAREKLDADRGIHREIVAVDSPSEQAAHRLQEVVGGMRPIPSPIPPGEDRALVNELRRLHAGGGLDCTIDGVSLLAGRGAEVGPLRALDVLPDEPREGARRRPLGRLDRLALYGDAVVAPERLGAVWLAHPDPLALADPHVPCDSAVAGGLADEVRRARAWHGGGHKMISSL